MLVIADETYNEIVNFLMDTMYYGKDTWASFGERDEVQNTIS